MSNYYAYRDVKVAIAERLMDMDGWKVYGYKPDNSDPMTDYFDPANWGGVAEKNGYILCVDVYGAQKPQEIREYNYKSFKYDKGIADKIEKLEQMTTARGASEQEEESAKKMIARLRKKAEESSENSQNYVVTGVIPGHMENPPRMNWHIEKDGVYVAKGNGLLKFSDITDYITYDHCKEDMEAFRKNKEVFRQSIIDREMSRYATTEKEANDTADRQIKSLESDSELLGKFDALIRKFDSTCGSMIGEGDRVTYEKAKVTEYKKENKAVETSTGSLKEGQCFVLKTQFTYGSYKGLVYRIHELDSKGSFHAFKLNGKLTKECTGTATQNNHWFINNEKFMKWIEKGAVAWCEIHEVKTPYEVEKVVKKVVKAEKKDTEKFTETPKESGYTYIVSEDVDTRNNEPIFLVKVKEKLEKEEYIKVNQYMKSLGGYYSRFKHAFLFKENPSESLNVAM